MIEILLVIIARTSFQRSHPNHANAHVTLTKPYDLNAAIKVVLSVVESYNADFQCFVELTDTLNFHGPWCLEKTVSRKEQLDAFKNIRQAMAFIEIVGEVNTTDDFDTAILRVCSIYYSPNLTRQISKKHSDLSNEIIILHCGHKTNENWEIQSWRVSDWDTFHPTGLSDTIQIEDFMNHATSAFNFVEKFNSGCPSQELANYMYSLLCANFVLSDPDFDFFLKSVLVKSVCNHRRVWYVFARYMVPASAKMVLRKVEFKRDFRPRVQYHPNWVEFLIVENDVIKKEVQALQHWERCG